MRLGEPASLKILALLLTVLLLAFSAPSAANTAADLRTYATRAGLPESVPIVDVDMGGTNAYYTPGGIHCSFLSWECKHVPEHIGLSLPADWPFEFKLAVLLHEVGHRELHRDRVWSTPDKEYEADAWALARLCEFGFNGPEALAGSLEAVYGPTLPQDSRTHGSPWERAERLRSKRCGPANGSQEA